MKKKNNKMPSNTPEESKRIKKKKPIFSVIIIIIGLLTMFYPWISNWLFDNQKQSEISSYNENVKNTSQEEIDKMFADAEKYNAELRKGQSRLTDPFIESGDITKDNYNSLLRVDDSGIMCTVKIPCINVNLPVFHGTGADILETGCGHLEGSSLPIGHNGDHAVITGHTGLNNAKLFTDLINMKEGDIFIINTLGKEMAYKVVEINIVVPEDISKLMIQPERDLVSLVTCTPYGVNSHRLIVTGERTEINEKEIEEAYNATVIKSQWMSAYLKAILIGLGISLIVLIILFIISRKMKKKKETREQKESL